MIKMVGRRFVVEHDGSNFDLDYDTEDGLEVLKFQLFSLTSLPPDQQKIVDVSGDRLVSEDAHLHSVSDVLRLLSLDGEDQGKNQATRIEDKPDDHHLQSDEEFARMLQAEEDALMMQRFVASENKEQIEQRIRPYVEQVLKYEDPVRQEAARKTVPMDKLEEKAFLMMAREGNFKPSKDEQNHAFLLQLLFWFKQSFRWVNSPPCDNCNNETANQGMGAATSSELQYGASRVELYRCKSCSNITRFPRYNDPLKLLETRKGRCGEWANCFTLYCRAFGYESRLILDFTDHVWTECFSQYLGRWMHLDPCEGIYDSPLLYEKGWNKNLNYVIGISKDEVHDVTKRYSKKWHEVLSRRNITTEPTLLSVLSNITRDLRKVLAPAMVLELEERDRIELESLERDPYLTDDPSIILPGRQSGSKEWRVSRSEFGSDDSLRSTSCPVRRCVDEHVTKIYNALSPILLQLVEEESFNKSKAVEVFESFKKILVDLKKSPFKTRKTSINSSSTDMTYFIIMLPAFAELLDALSLKSETGKNGIINICLASDPVKTSISLPVVFHALDDVIDNINQCNKLDKGSFSWPLLKLNRICSGLVLASGEELPFGIVTSAFDGTRLSKWEEPNGATGCWIIYKLPNNQMHELVAYEMMSANDAPERDPRDWIVEGSEDSGASWRILDRQNSQAFEKRFQRRTFIFESQGFLANAFRIQFLVVRDDKANSRFQIGSIDLYSKSSCVS